MVAMRSTGILTFVALLMTAQARPDGYGVKGGRSHQSTASAVASAHAHADTGSAANAKSSASAIATADSTGTSNAVAVADATVVAANSGKNFADDKENKNANESTDSGDLRDTTDRGRGTEYKCADHGDGTDTWNQRDLGAKHVTPSSGRKDTENMGPVRGYTDCGDEAINGHGSAHKDKARPCETPGADAAYIGKDLKPPEIDSSHTSGPCATGDTKCPLRHPGVAAGTASPAGIKGGYENDERAPIDASHASSPCAPGHPKCFASKPAISGHYPAHQNSDSSYSQSSFTEKAKDHTKEDGKPEIAKDQPGPSCPPGDSMCLQHQQAITRPHANFGERPDSSAGLSTGPKEIEVGYEGHGQGIGQPEGNVHRASGACATGTICPSMKPGVWMPHPTHGQVLEHPRYDQKPQHPTETSNGPEETESPQEHDATPCSPGNPKCFGHKPSVSNPYPSYDKNPDPSAGSTGPGIIDGGYGGTSGAGTPNVPSACAPWDSKCSPRAPTAQKLPTKHEEEQSTDSQYPKEMVTGYEQGSSKPGTLGASHPISPCANGDCPRHKPSVPSSHAIHDANPVAWTPVDGHGAPGKVPSQQGTKPKTSNPFLNGQIDLSSIVNRPNPGKPVEQKVKPPNPFLNGQIDSSNMGNRPSSDKPVGHKVNPSNPFLNPHSQVARPTGQNYPANATPQHPQSDPTFSPMHPQNIPKPPNPFFSQTKYTETFGSKHPGSTNVQPSVVDDSSNIDCHGVSCTQNNPAAISPATPGHPQGTTSLSAHTPSKPNPANPFLSHQGDGQKHATDFRPADQGNIPQTPSQLGSLGSGKNCDASSTGSKISGEAGPSENPFLKNYQPEKQNLNPTRGPTQFPAVLPGNGGFAPNHVGGHIGPVVEKPEGPSDCRSSVICSNVPNKADHDSSVTGGLHTGTTLDRKEHGVKGHGAGVKGHQHQHPIRLQGSSGLGDDVGVHPAPNPSVDAIAIANASAHASGSSHGAHAHSNASAKSEAHSNQGANGSSSSWASSSASASAYASSYDSHHEWKGQALPEIPAQ